MLLEQKRNKGIKPDVCTYSTSITVCEKGGKWEEALLLFRQMPGAGIKPNFVSYRCHQLQRDYFGVRRGWEMGRGAVTAQGDGSRTHQA